MQNRAARHGEPQGGKGISFSSWIAWPFLLLLAIVLWTRPLGAAEQPRVYVDPATTTVTVGDVFYVDVRVQDISDLAAIDPLEITFDPTMLQVRDSVPTIPEVQIEPGEVFSGTMPLLNRADNMTGQIAYSIARFGTPYSGNGILARIAFTATQMGSSDILPQRVQLLDSAFGEIKVITETGRVTIVAAATATPSSTPSNTPEPTVTHTATPLPTDTPTATQTLSPTATLTPSPSQEPGTTETSTLTPSVTGAPVETTMPTPTIEETATATPPGTITWVRLPLILRNRGVAVPTSTPSAEASATSTPTTMPSATTTVQPTIPTQTSTPTATVTTTPTACYELLAKGDFEGEAADLDTVWRREITPYTAEYTTLVYHNGAQAVRLGILPGNPIRESHSTLYTAKAFTIPANALSATLRFWWKRGTEESTSAMMSYEATSSRSGISLGDLSYYADTQEVLLLKSDYHTIVRVLERGLASDDEWIMSTHDLTPWRGQKLVLYFNAFNTAWGGRTWMYIDDITLEVCVPRS